MRNAGAIACALFVFACSPDKRGAEHPDAAGPGQEAGNGGGDSGDGSMTYVYAHTSSTLYKVDPDTLAITMVGDFGWPGLPDQMTDLAIDKNGVMVGVSFGSVYKVDATTAQATMLSSGLGGTFNGLSFVPASMLGMTGDDVLIGTRNDDGVVSRIDPMTGAVSTVGNMGSAFQSSGDLVAVDGFGTVQTTLGAASGDVLVRLAPNSFAATTIGTATGFGEIWGLGFWKNKIFGFTRTGNFITIDPTTGAGTLVQGGGPEWWGAAVTTSAPVLQ